MDRMKPKVTVVMHGTTRHTAESCFPTFHKSIHQRQTTSYGYRNYWRIISYLHTWGLSWDEKYAP